MKLNILSVLCAGVACVAATPFSDSWSRTHGAVTPASSSRQQKDLACAAPAARLSVRGGGVLDRLDQGKVMDLKTALKFKAG
jgi:hypothetical protein